MSIFRQHFERMIIQHAKKCDSMDKNLIPLEEVSESHNVEDTDYHDDDSEDLVEDSDDSSTEENSDDSNSESDSDSDASSCYVDDIIDSLNSKRTPISTKDSEDAKKGLFLSLDMVQLLRASTSESDLFANERASIIDSMMPRRNSVDSETVKPSGIVYCIQSKNPLQSSYNDNEDFAHPKDILKSILSEKMYTDFPRGCDTLENYFICGKSSGYSTALMTAVRQDNLTVIQKMHEDGENLQCCNQFGESVLHAVARRGRADILKYLVNEAGVSLRVCCDTGRNPLHDACWTTNPNFDCITFILEECADLLLIADKRGFTPLDYAPKDSYRRWSYFFEAQRNNLSKNLKFFAHE